MACVQQKLPFISQSLHAKSQHMLADTLSAACATSAWHAQCIVQVLHACMHACMLMSYDDVQWWTHAATVPTEACMPAVTHLLCCRTSQMPSTLQASLTASCGLATHIRIFASGVLGPCPGKTEHKGCSWDLGWSSFLWLPLHSIRNTTMSPLDTGCERLAMAKHECHGIGNWLDSLCEVTAYMAAAATSAETRACNETRMISS